jgi:hypothetical protein
MLQSDDVGRGALIWTTQHKDVIPSPPKVEMTAVQAPVLENGPLIAVATRDTGPEQWQLAASDGVSLGRALIRRLAVSTMLRSVKGDTVRVLVEWVPSFKKWEICGSTDLPARHSSTFLPA